MSTPRSMTIAFAGICGCFAWLTVTLPAFYDSKALHDAVREAGDAPREDRDGIIRRGKVQAQREQRWIVFVSTCLTAAAGVGFVYQIMRSRLPG